MKSWIHKDGFVRLFSKRTFLMSILLTMFASSSFALERKVFCVWDPVGRSGPVMAFYSDLIPKAQAWGLSIRFIAYTDEKVAANEFKAGKCEAVLLSAILSRQFVKFGGTMDAIGAISSQKGLEMVLKTLARPRAGKLMTQGPFEVVATFPVGSMYAFVNNRSINSIEDFAGRRISVLNNDPQALKFAKLAGASPVGTTLSTFAPMFNNGNIDILLMPALAYNTFELYHGLGERGGIIDYRLYYGMLQTIARKSEFPADFGHKMRNYIFTRLRAIDRLVKDAEKEIPSKYWINVDQFTKDDIDHFSKRVRLALKKDDVNHPTALKLLWKIRCRLDRSRGECTRPE
ncbi:putative solute-binding protein [Oleiphilus sp. HI0080]|nr:putative solute-binding protein [Oleiphilus sp. HI0080]